MQSLKIRIQENALLLKNRYLQIWVAKDISVDLVDRKIRCKTIDEINHQVENSNKYNRWNWKDIQTYKGKANQRVMLTLCMQLQFTIPQSRRIRKSVRFPFCLYPGIASLALRALFPRASWLGSVTIILSKQFVVKLQRIWTLAHL